MAAGWGVRGCERMPSIRRVNSRMPRGCRWCLLVVMGEGGVDVMGSRRRVRSVKNCTTVTSSVNTTPRWQLSGRHSNEFHLFDVALLFILLARLSNRRAWSYRMNHPADDLIITLSGQYNKSRLFFRAQCLLCRCQREGKCYSSSLSHRFLLFALSQTSRATLADITFSSLLRPRVRLFAESLSRHRHTRRAVSCGRRCSGETCFKCLGRILIVDERRHILVGRRWFVRLWVGVGSAKVQLNHPGGGYDGDTCDTRHVLNQKHKFSVWLRIKGR